MVITNNIELRVVGDAEEKKRVWQFLRDMNHITYKAYNLVISNQYFNAIFTDRIRKTDEELAHRDEKLEKEIAELSKEIKETKDKDEKEKLKEKKNKLHKAQNALTKEARAKAEQMYACSEENSTYQLLAKTFTDMPSAIRACINQDAVKCFRNDIFDVRQGKKSIRTYKKGTPIPFQKTSMRFFVSDDKEIGMNWLNNSTFMLMFGRDNSNYREIVELAMAGQYKYCDSKIIIEDKKIFLKFCVDKPENIENLDKKLAVGVNLGIVVPAYCALSEGHARQSIGTMEDLFHMRIQMQQRRRRLQKRLKMVSGGAGRDKKLKALNTVTEKERNFVRTYNHMISSNIIKFALKNNAGVIKMELLEGYGKDSKGELIKVECKSEPGKKVHDDYSKTILRNWSYFELHSMVEYKAKKYGIEVAYTDPYRISQTCNCCGKYHEDNLETRDDFVCKNEECKNYKKKVFSDYNAALNNAQSLRIVTKKEDCIINKKKEEEED